MAEWKESLKNGEEFEEFLINDIQSKLDMSVTKNNDPVLYKFFDLTLANGITIECKRDNRAEESKNICIESHCNGNESGILTTTADYWIITDNLRGYIVKTSKLKKFIYDGHTQHYPFGNPKFLHREKFGVDQGTDVFGNTYRKEMDFYIIPIRMFLECCEGNYEIDKMDYSCLNKQVIENYKQEEHANMLDNILEWFDGEELLKADGFDDAIIGIESSSMRLIYSVSKCIKILVKEGMDEEEAVEHFDFNVGGGYVGEKTPIWCVDDV